MSIVTARLRAQVALIPATATEYTAVQVRPRVDLAEMLTAIIDTDCVIPLGDTVTGKLAELEATVLKMRKLVDQWAPTELTISDVTSASARAKVAEWADRNSSHREITQLADTAISEAVHSLQAAAEQAQPDWLATLDTHYRDRYHELYVQGDSINDPKAVILQRDRDRRQIDRLHDTLRNFAGLEIWCATTAELLVDRYRFQTPQQWAALMDRTGGGFRLQSPSDSYEQIMTDIGVEPGLFAGGRAERAALIADLTQAVIEGQKAAQRPRSYVRLPDL
ncbi:hypothetical protein GZH49_00550 [Nocardia terpenica]|uniref:hypothetical protein n=1 Tax=Nocardia terpenica TaxID=455432 RepID=UPI002FE21DE4